LFKKAIGKPIPDNPRRGEIRPHGDRLLATNLQTYSQRARIVVLFTFPEVGALHRPFPANHETEHAARFLHDRVAPLLSVVGLHLDLLREECEFQPVAATRIDEIQNTVELLMEDVRSLSNQLRNGRSPENSKLGTI
jgi:hypothetical protein